MFYPYKLSINTNWKTLPWKKLYSRLSSIQYKIYRSTKEYNFLAVNMWQKYLLNCNEIKIIAMQYVVDELFNYHHYNKNFKYTVSDLNKFYLLQQLNIKNHNIKEINILSIYEQIKLYLMYIAVKPEWDAKFSLVMKYDFINNSNSYCQRLFNNTSKKINHITSVLYDINYKSQYFFYKKIKLQVKLLKDVYFARYSKISQVRKLFVLFNISLLSDFKYNLVNEIYSYFVSIFVVGLDWYAIYLEKLYLEKNYKILNIRSNSLYVRQITRKNLFKLNSEGKFLTKIAKMIVNKTYIFKCLINNKIIYIFNPDVCIYFVSLLQNYYYKLNTCIHYLMKKKYFRSLSYNSTLFKISYKLNQVFYQRNINCKYFINLN